MKDSKWILKLLEIIQPYLSIRIKLIWVIIINIASYKMMQFIIANERSDEYNQKLMSLIDKIDDLEKREIEFTAESARYRQKQIIDSVQNKIYEERVNVQQEKVAMNREMSVLRSKADQKIQTEIANQELRKLFQSLIDSLTYSFNDIPRGFEFNSSDMMNDRQQLMKGVLAQAISLSRQLNIEHDYAEFFKKCGYRYRKRLKNEVDN